MYVKVNSGDEKHPISKYIAHIIFQFHLFNNVNISLIYSKCQKIIVKLTESIKILIKVVKDLYQLLMANLCCIYYTIN